VTSPSPNIRRGPAWAILLIALLAGALTAIPVAADGRVFSPLPARERGLQVDSVVFSPQTAPLPGALNGWNAGGLDAEVAQPAGRTYVVQPGDTLSQIAARFDLDLTSLATANHLKNPDHIEVGQTLSLGEAAALPATPSLDGDLVRLQVWPWPPIQGQTMAVWLQASRPVSFEVSLDGAAVPVIGQGRRGWALVPIPALSAPGDKTLQVIAGNTRAAIPVPVGAGSFDSYHIPAAVSRPILDQTQKVQAEAARLRELVNAPGRPGWTPRSRFSSPLEGDYPRSSPYGSRRTYEPNPAVSAHEGEDFSAPAGTPVIAPAAGVVVLAEPLFVRGNAVVLDHGSGVFTGYWHLQELAVRRGDRVEPGQLLGRVGSTGLSTGAHLHWELRVNGVAVDPLQWVGD
jgi:murein DD-endopeptidase MepM/ murein hydrolase activator NlpD